MTNQSPKFCYVVCAKGGRILAVTTNEKYATYLVNENARIVHDINPTTDPTDFDGALMRYGWADIVWWQKEVLYD